MLEKTTCEKFCQKRPPTSGGTPGQATCGTCRLGQCRQAPAAVRIAGMWPGLEAAGHAASATAGTLSLLHGRVPALPLAAGGHVIVPAPGKAAGPTRPDGDGRAGNGNGGRGLPALAQAARATCRLARGAATRRGSFLTKFFAGGLF
jgi:hypothetical protein